VIGTLRVLQLAAQRGLLDLADAFGLIKGFHPVPVGSEY
jgi:hypothetical protein